jgi:predicted PurR-regulated permease PerM
MKEIFQRINQYLAFLILLVIILYYGKVVILPVAFAALLAMLMAPVCRFLDRKGFKRGLSSFTCILIIVIAIAGMMAIVAGQISAFRNDYPKIKAQATTLIARTQQYVEQRIGIEPEKQKEIAKQQTKATQEKGGSVIKKIFSGIASTIGSLILTLVYTFLMIYNKEQFETFFLRLYRDEDQEKVKKIVRQIAHVSEKYLTGRLMSIGVIALMYSIGLTIVGIKNAILLACIAALMTVIPYLGTTLGGLFPVFMAFATEDSIQPAIWAGVVLFFIQTMDNYFIEPNIVGGEVNLSAFSSIFSIIAGGIIWGIAGMILFLPLAGIIKIVCDHVDELKPVGYLIGEPGGKKPSRVKEWIQEKIRSRKAKH